MLSFTIGASSISVFLDGTFNSIDSSHANFPLLLAELQKAPSERDIEAIRTFISIKTLIEHMSIGRVTVFDDEIQFDGKPVHNYLAERMLEMLNQGIDLSPFAAFMDNVFDNPAPYAIDELYQWLEKAKMPITPDGCFLAFKKVRRDYTDCHSGMFDNSPGTLLEMDRAACNPNRDETCSTGFHFCSIGYIGNFGGERVVVVKVNPRDVTSIPSDYNFTKGRCCKYEVVAELTDQSAAYHNCWRKGVADLENPAEFPAGILVAAEADEVEYQSATEALEEIDKEQVELTQEQRWELAASWIEDATTDAGKTSDGTDLTKEDIQAAIDKVGAGWTAGDPIDLPPMGLTLTVSLEDEDHIFGTTDGREFSETVIRAALKDASIRGAARNLGIGDSTLRGWMKKLGL